MYRSFFLSKPWAGLFILPFLLSWGFFAHKEINHHAVFSLPEEMLFFYKRGSLYLTEHAVDPDKRRYALPDEAARHYIDLDHYNNLYYDHQSLSYSQAVYCFSEDSLKKHGVLPWAILRNMNYLKQAFKAHDQERILKYSADLGHYIGDAHVPLHTTSNYNGQQTNQHGIHGLWESRLPELFFTQYQLWVGHAEYLATPEDSIWKCIFESHDLVPIVLKEELLSSLKITEEKKYCIEYRNGMPIQTYSPRFCKEYNTRLGHMVEERLRKAIKLTADCWYTCWINAGKPELPLIENKQYASFKTLRTKGSRAEENCIH